MTTVARVLCGAVLLIVTMSATGCGGEHSAEPPGGPAVATIDGVPITAEAFRLSYEFSHSSLRRRLTALPAHEGDAPDDPKRTYLRLMIYEKLLADEARRLRLDTLQAVRNAARTLREEVLIEEVFDAYVLDDLHIDSGAVRARALRGAVRFRFRFLPAESERDARALRQSMLAEGYDATRQARQARYRELGLWSDEWTSPLLTADEIAPAILAAIQDLPLDTPSPPVRYDGQWYVFEVIDIRRAALTPEALAERMASAQTVLYNEAALAKGTAFVDSLMTPLGVTTRRAGFEVLDAALWAWYRDETPTGNLLAALERGRATPYAKPLRQHLDRPLVRFESSAAAPGGTWSIRTFLRHFTPGRYVLRARDRDAFRARLADVVALVVRDFVLLQMAEQERLAEAPDVRHAFARWEDKWLFRAYVQHALSRPTDASAAEDTPTAHVAASARAAARRADSLWARTEVVIHETVLDTLQVSPPGQHRTVQLFKSHSMKAPFPVVEPTWAALR